jgi:hypothetical protein
MLTGAVLGGRLLGYLTEFPEVTISVLVAFLAGASYSKYLPRGAGEPLQHFSLGYHWLCSVANRYMMGLSGFDGKTSIRY